MAQSCSATVLVLVLGRECPSGQPLPCMTPCQHSCCAASALCWLLHSDRLPFRRTSKQEYLRGGRVLPCCCAGFSCLACVFFRAACAEIVSTRHWCTMLACAQEQATLQGPHPSRNTCAVAGDCPAAVLVRLLGSDCPSGKSDLCSTTCQRSCCCIGAICWLLLRNRLY